MRIAIDIPDSLHRRLKAAAALRGLSVTDIIVTLVSRELQGVSRRKNRVKLPLVESRRPGRLRLTNAEVNEILFA
jgi:uncharacterized protein (DUF1778 family)